MQKPIVAAVAIVGASALALGVLAAQTSDVVEPRPFGLGETRAIAALQPFEDCNEFLGWVRAAALERVGPYGLTDRGPWVMYDTMAGAEATDDADSAPRDAQTAAPTVTTAVASTTNNQVSGVDEPDVIKTDGRYLYTVAGGRLLVVDTTTDSIVGRVQLTDDGAFAGRDLLIAGDRALVLGGGSWYGGVADTGVAVDAIFPGPYPGSASGTFVIEVDLSDRSAPEVTDRVRIDGAYTSARLVGGVARIVVSADPTAAFGFVQPTVPGERGERRAETMNRALIEESVASDWLPTAVRVDSGGDELGEPAPLLDCSDAAHPDRFSGFSMLTVLTVDLADGLDTGLERANGAGVLATGATVYANAEHLYVAAPEYVEWDALSNREVEIANRNFGTDLHRFDITDPETTTYDGSGTVKGSLLNQFAMDEFEGVLRVATTTAAQWSASDATIASESAVTTFAFRNDALEQIGRVGDLGRDEQIQGVRFIGTTGYVVTFRQTDPLYTIDLTDPGAPRVVGELKILGYSAYLHPVTDGLLLGVGIDATDTGTRTGLQVSLFDVSDPANPQRVAQYALADAGSSAEWDHHAFTWWPTGDTSGIAYLPYEGWARDIGILEGDAAPTTAAPSMGALALTVDLTAATIAEAGRISHQGRPVAAGSDSTYLPIDRIVVIGDRVWTRSEGGLLETALDGAGTSAWVQFPAAG